ncbi:MAG TPA: hypothetical protein PKL19_02370 [Candidatus Dojkabacteria bacterium]|jgi:hypothetical protein|nr:hypothetical protein [Candidatus Dojkabacteria bacterium]
MNNLMNRIEIYSNVLRIRSKFKRVQQLSWNVSKIEQKFDVENIEDDDELKALYEAYLSLIDELELTYNELKNEKAKKSSSK